jgi:hypothetical protein
MLGVSDDFEEHMDNESGFLDFKRVDSQYEPKRKSSYRVRSNDK